MSTNGHYDLPCLCSLLSIIQATLVLLSSSIQGNQAATITVSTSLTILPSSTIQRNSTTNSLSYNATTVAFLRTATIVSSVFLSSSSSSATHSLVASRYSKTKTWSQVSEATASPSTSISVNQYNYTAVPAMPTTVLIIKGLPSVKVVAAIAGVLGLILLILLAVIVWHMCIVEVLPMRRRSSRVAPSEATESAISDVL